MQEFQQLREELLTNTAPEEGGDPVWPIMDFLLHVTVGHVTKSDLDYREYSRQHSGYTWVLTRDVDPYQSSSLVLKVRTGPTGAETPAPPSEVIRDGERFRMLEESGKSKVSGYIIGKYSGIEPLLDYGSGVGCTRIEYQRDGKWTRLASD